MIYIDPYNNSISNLTRLAGMLQDTKNQTVDRRLRQAQLLRDAGENIKAQEMLRSAQNYGLSRLFAPDAQEWTAEGINANLNRTDIPLKEKQAEYYGGVDATQGGLLAQLKQNYIDPNTGKFDKAGYEKQINLLKLGVGMDNPSATLDLVNNPDKGAQKRLPEIANKFLSDDTIKSQVNAYNQLEKDNAPIKKVNAAIDEYNAKAEALNKSKPIYREKYTGNEVDQQQQLMDDTINAMDSAKSMNEKLNIYSRYVTTGKGISDHYGHRFEGQPAAFFGIGGKSNGGTGAKTERINIYMPGQEKPIGAVKVSDSFLTSSDPQAFIFKNFKGIMDRNGIKDPSQFTYKFASSEGTNELNPYEQVKMKKDNVELDEFYKSQAQKAYDDANDITTWKTSTKVKNANAKIAPDNPFAWDESGNLVDTRTVQGTSSNADNNTSTGYQHLYLKKK